MDFGSKSLDLTRPQIMGVLNMTPDSFFDGGRFVKTSERQPSAVKLEGAMRAAEKMIEDGAAIIDVGGESTRPGAVAVSEQEEMDRVLPIVEALSKSTDAIISVDTSTAALITAAARLGAGLINDVRALEREGALLAAAEAQLPVCLMHMQGNPKTMQHNPVYQDVTADVASYLRARAEACKSAGISPDRILLDPGFGFGKEDEHNLKLLQSLPRIAQEGYPLLVGMSRKSIIGRLLGREPQDRLAGSLALAVLAAQKGASIIRVHDVAETHDVLTLLAHVENVNSNQF